jgi:hypothetical protein
METLIEGLKIAVVLWSYVFWGIGLWVTILVSSQLRDDHRGESLTVPHPRRVSTPFLSLWSSTSFLSLTVECANAPWCLFRYISHGKALSRYRRTYLKSKAPLILGLKGLIRSWVNPASKVLINPLIFFTRSLPGAGQVRNSSPLPLGFTYWPPQISQKRVEHLKVLSLWSSLLTHPLLSSPLWSSTLKGPYQSSPLKGRSHSLFIW